MPKSPTKPSISNVDELRVESRPGYEALPTLTMPVSEDALTSLLDRIKQVFNDETSSQKNSPAIKEIALSYLTEYFRCWPDWRCRRPGDLSQSLFKHNRKLSQVE
jgi:hypothetical protein